MRAVLVALIAALPICASGSCGFLAISGDFEHDTIDWYITGEIVADPLHAANHAAALHGEPPAAMAPVVIPPSVDAVEVRFRVLAPRTLKLQGDSKLLLRVRLYSEKGNS